MGEGELTLWERCRGGDQTAREELILHYWHLVDRYAKRVAKSAFWTEIDDLRQEGVFGLMRAVRRFDPSSGVPFAAYADKHIRGAVTRNPEVVRTLKRLHYNNYRLIEETREKLSQVLTRPPTLDEIAKEAGLTVTDAMDSIFAMRLVSGESADFDLENCPDIADPRASSPYSMVLIHQAMKMLSDTEQDVLIDFYWNDKTDLEIGFRRGEKADTVKQRRYRALKKLRKLLAG